jgi:dihydrofolate reductase
MNMKIISIIVAVSEDWGIGLNNSLLWNIPEDMKRFKSLTYGNNIIMGKRTWESLPRRPLPGRKNIVITDMPSDKFDNAVAAYSVEDAISKCDAGKEIFIIGGGSIYRQFMDIADRLYITHVHSSAPSDVYFPEIDLKIWEVIIEEEYRAGETTPVPYTYRVYARRN